MKTCQLYYRLLVCWLVGFNFQKKWDFYESCFAMSNYYQSAIKHLNVIISRNNFWELSKQSRNVNFTWQQILQTIFFRKLCSLIKVKKWKGQSLLSLLLFMNLKKACKIIWIIVKIKSARKPPCRRENQKSQAYLESCTYQHIELRICLWVVMYRYPDITGSVTRNFIIGM